jgi:hypothetical protein
MNKIIISVLFLTLVSCSTFPTKIKREEPKNLTEVADSIVELEIEDINKPIEQINQNNEETLSDEELLKKWTWGDKISKPTKSSITNTNFNNNLLLKEWSYPGDEKPILQISQKYFDVYYQQFIYTVNYDTIRIFTNADHPGGGVNRGIITFINDDSLTIEWSTDDKNTYISNKKTNTK